MASQSITAILSKAYDNGERSIPFHRIVYADGRVWIDKAHRAERLRLYCRRRAREMNNLFHFRVEEGIKR